MANAAPLVGGKADVGSRRPRSSHRKPVCVCCDRQRL